MKRAFAFFAALFLFLTLISINAFAGKIDLPLQMMSAKPTLGKAMFAKSMNIKDGSIGVLIKVSDVNKVSSAIAANGGRINSVVGKIISAMVKESYLKKLSEMPEVIYIESSIKMTPRNDSSRAQTGVATLQSGFEGTSYNGKNVVVGVIDTGLDYSRDDFKNTDGVTRVQYMRFQTVSGTTTDIVECAQDKLADATCEIPNTNDAGTAEGNGSHGTHVTGIAAGSDATFTGVAPAADIMLVRNDYSGDDVNETEGTFSAGVLDGVTEIFKKADILDKPAVINISQGTHIGAHDGTSLLEEGIAEAVAGGYADNGKNYGRIVVAAAGNEHLVAENAGDGAATAGGIHGSINIPAGSSRAFRYRLASVSGNGRYPMPILMDAWFAKGQGANCTVAAYSYKYPKAMSAGVTTTDAVAYSGEFPMSEAKDATAKASTDNMVSVIVAVDPAAIGDRPRALFGFTPGSAGTWTDMATGELYNKGYIMDIVIRATSGACTGNIWIEGGGSLGHFMKAIDSGSLNPKDGDNGKGYSFLLGDNNYTVGLPATSGSVIAVGAYLSEKPAGSGTSKWTDTAGNVHDATDNAGSASAADVNGGTVGVVCPFSSIGPSGDGRMKPDVIAPGDPIISTLATGAEVATELRVNNTHYKNQGTSQASPHVAGIVALLLQKNNRLTQSQVTAALTENATAPTAAAITAGKAASYESGYGKVNATAAMAAIPADTTGYAGTGTLKTSDLESSSSGSSGCGLLAVGFSGSSATQIFTILVALSGLVGVRRKFR